VSITAMLGMIGGMSWNAAVSTVDATHAAAVTGKVRFTIAGCLLGDQDDDDPPD
jgi:hypothetical protein